MVVSKAASATGTGSERSGGAVANDETMRMEGRGEREDTSSRGVNELSQLLLEGWTMCTWNISI